MCCAAELPLTGRSWPHACTSLSLSTPLPFSFAPCHYPPKIQRPRPLLFPCLIRNALLIALICVGLASHITTLVHAAAAGSGAGQMRWLASIQGTAVTCSHQPRAGAAAGMKQLYSGTLEWHAAWPCKDAPPRMRRSHCSRHGGGVHAALLGVVQQPAPAAQRSIGLADSVAALADSLRPTVQAKPC